MSTATHIPVIFVDRERFAVSQWIDEHLPQALEMFAAPFFDESQSVWFGVLNLPSEALPGHEELGSEEEQS